MYKTFEIGPHFNDVCTLADFDGETMSRLPIVLGFGVGHCEYTVTVATDPRCYGYDW